MQQRYDPFPTVTLSVPHLKEVLARLRDAKLRRAITIVHALRDGEGDWILATTSARLKRGPVRHLGPEPMNARALVEQASRIGAQIVLAGEMRRSDDAQALRAAAALGMRVAAVVTAPERREVENLLAVLGPWEGYDLRIISRQAP
ncbi:MAG: hypothetical protein KGN02_06950 [bacterium]|nr:hypothetical protein [bacterium]